MKMFKNKFWSIAVDLNILSIFGFMVPSDYSPRMKKLLWAYWLFLAVFINGINIIIQIVDLLVIWGDLSLMVENSILLFTNLAFGVKIVMLRFRRDAVLTIIEEGEQELKYENRAEGRDIIDNCSRVTAKQLQFYLLMSIATILGWVASTEQNSLIYKAWYPFDEYRSPVYEITYAHQTISLFLGTIAGIGMDSLITSLMAVCYCRFRLLKLSLRNLCRDLEFKEKNLLGPDQERMVSVRLRNCIMRHQAALRSAAEIQTCFTETILVQFTVSIIIICVSAYDLSVSAEISYAAYQCEWYKCSPRFRRALLVVMVRASREATVNAGGFSTLSLECFASIIKSSYSFFAMLQQLDK